MENALVYVIAGSTMVLGIFWAIVFLALIISSLIK